MIPIRIDLKLSMILTVVTIGGCSGHPGPERAVVSGVVTYQGQPVEAGDILFVPEAGTQAPTSGGVISGGKYRVDSKGGVPVGTHKVEIKAYRQNQAASNSAGPGDPDYGGARAQYLPERYHAKTELKMTVAPGSHAVSHDFRLE